MPTADGNHQANNAQSGKDIESHVVVTTDVDDRCNDKSEVVTRPKRLDALPTAIGKLVGLLADTGHFSGTNVAHCEGARLTSRIAARRKAHHVPHSRQCALPLPCPKDADSVTRTAHGRWPA